ncbi:MAG TPA: type II toxin-antitoxin system HipA family toxin [Thiotrichaceae bacterium]|nr:type II toxin-antitoxin system HipA family toxin [Thiotrichaceae bacterium]
MRVFKPIDKLMVYRRLSTGKELVVGQLAQNKQGIYFQYDAHYLQQSHSLSPFNLAFDASLSKAPAQPHQGLHGAFSDSLPDGWGLLVMDRIFRQHQINPHQITAMDRLAYIGESGMGALSYRPTSSWKENESAWVGLDELGKQAMQLFDGEENAVLAALANTGGSGGARPKALIYRDPKKLMRVSTIAQPNLEPWLIKFTSKNLLLGHEEGVCEAAYLTMASLAGIDTPEWQLLNPPEQSQAKAWLAMKRFDVVGESGRYHMHSLCGLMDADFRQPSMDYDDVIKVTQVLCNPAAGKQQFVRAMFNLLADNQDDHTKNTAFLMDDQGQWQLSPFYDVTFSPNPHHQHWMSYGGYGNQPSLKATQQLAAQANFSSWKQAQQEIDNILEALGQWEAVAHDLGVGSDTIALISKQLNQVYQDNKHLF